MNKIGVIMCVYDANDLLGRFFKPWVEYREKYKNHEVIFSVVHCCFQENFEQNDKNIYSRDGTIDTLKQLKAAGKIDYLNILDFLVSECEGRNQALAPLLENGCDYILSTAPDEFFEADQIDKLFNYIVQDPFIALYKINYKNLVFTPDQWVEGFCPNRIWKAQISKNQLVGFQYDDDMYYKTLTGHPIVYTQDKHLPSKIIPRNVCWPKHETWLDGERSRKKIHYQTLRFGKNGCSFQINQNGFLSFNSEYYRKTNFPFPVVNQE